MPEIREITPLELKAKLAGGEKLTLIDVREKFESEICSIGGTLIPMNQIMERLNEIPRDHPVIVYCRSGGRSGNVVAALQEKNGFTNLYNLSGGILGWIEEVDDSLTPY